MPSFTTDPRELGGDAVSIASSLGVGQLRLERPRAEALLEKSKLARLVVVSAPAGYGKSALLKKWREELSKEVDFVISSTFIESYNKPLHFLSEFLKLVESAIPDYAGSLLGQLKRVDADSVDDTQLSKLADKLVGDLSIIGTKGAIFIDDFQKVSNAFVLQIINRIIQHLPGSIRCYVACRGTPSIPLAKYRAKGQLLEIGVADLKLSTEEAAALLNDVYQLALPSEQLGTLYNKTEGWISGLSLAAASMPVAKNERSDFIHDFSGSTALVSHYFFEHVLFQLSPDLQVILKKISIAEKICGDLINTLAGRTDGQEILEQLEREQMFVFPLDKHRKWYKMAPLMAECLRNHLLKEGEHAAEHLHFSASLWFTNHGMHEEAVYHALMSNDMEMAASLISECGNDLINKGQMYDLFQWSALIPEQDEVKYPILTLLSAWRHAWSQNFDAALTLVEKVLQHITDIVSSPKQIYTSDDYASAIAVKTLVALQKDDLEECISLAEEWLPKFENVSPFLTSMTAIMASLAYMVKGNPDQSKRMLHVAQRFSAGLDGKYLLILTNAVQTLYELESGLLKEALSHQKASLEWSKGLLHPASGEPITIPHVTSGMVRYEANELDGLEEWFERACSSKQMIMPMELYGLSFLYLSRLRVIRGDYESAERALSGLRALCEENKYNRIMLMAVSEHVCILLSLNKIEDADRLVERYGLKKIPQPESEFSNIFWFASKALIRLDFAKGEYDKALERVQNLDQMLVPNWHDYRRIRLQLLKAKIIYRSGDMDAGLTVLKGVLTTAEAEQYVRSFLDEGALMQAMLKRLLADSLTNGATSKRYIELLLENFDQASDNSSDEVGAESAAIPSEHGLTKRECQILALAAAGNTNQQIGEKTFLSLGTVKWHLHNVYGKLNVRNRTHAIKKAKELGAI